MSYQQQSGGRIRVGFKQGMTMLFPYARSRLLDQIKSVALIIVYLIFFQTIVLGIAIAQALMIAVGLALVIVGLTFFMEGLTLGLMPLGQVIGLKLPQKSKLPVILGFAFILGVGATLAEPAISVLKAAGSVVKAWEAPLLFLMLNKFSGYLVMAVGAGVGIAVVFGMIRFIYNMSLKPFIYTLCSFLLVFTVWSFFNENMKNITGLAWDSGAVTTGPVTVPLVLALSIGICRVVGSAESGSSGFGVVTLASLFPIVSVLLLGAALVTSVPAPMSEAEFFKAQNRDEAQALFSGREQLIGYALQNAGESSQLALFDGDREKMFDYLKILKRDADLRSKVFGPGEEDMEKWAALKGTSAQREVVFADKGPLRQAVAKYSGATEAALQPADLMLRNARLAAQAILPLSIFFFLVLTLLLRERLPRADEVFLGLALAVFGVMLFNIGIEIGLSRLANQVGSKVPSSFKAIELTEQKSTIEGFDPNIVRTAISAEGKKELFFYVKEKNRYVQLPYYEKQYNTETRQYNYTPMRGPLFGSEGGVAGIVVVLLLPLSSAMERLWRNRPLTPSA